MTEIRRLFQQGKEFVPISLAEAVVVNTNNLPQGVYYVGINQGEKALTIPVVVVKQIRLDDKSNSF